MEIEKYLTAKATFKFVPKNFQGLNVFLKYLVVFEKKKMKLKFQKINSVKHIFRFNEEHLRSVKPKKKKNLPLRSTY